MYLMLLMEQKNTNTNSNNYILKNIKIEDYLLVINLFLSYTNKGQGYA